MYNNDSTSSKSASEKFFKVYFVCMPIILQLEPAKVNKVNVF